MPSLLRAGAALVAAIVLAALISWLALRAERSPGPASALPFGATVIDDDAIMLNRTPAQIDAAVGDFRRLGADWLRVNAQWSRIAPAPAAARRPRFDARDPAAYPPHAWDRLDQAVRLATARGMRVMIDIGFWAPRWATTRTVAPADRQRWEIDAGDFGDFAHAVARRYSGHYAGLPAARGYTLWNEPNYSVFLLPQRRWQAGVWRAASPDVYRRMVYAGYPAIKAAAPGSFVLIGGTAATGSRRPRSPLSGVAPLEFLRRLACVSDTLEPIKDGGCRGFRPLPGDGWAHHPYSGRRAPLERDPDPDSANLADLGRLSDLLARLHDAGKIERPLGVFVTEYGFQTNPPDPTQPWTPSDQARFLPEAESLAYSHPSVMSFAQFLLLDLPAHRGRTLPERWSDFQSGLRLPDGREKPAWAAFRLPLVASPAPDGNVAFWARVRPGRGARTARIRQLGRDGRWGPAAGLPSLMTTDERGFVTALAHADPRGVYRLEARFNAGWIAGAAVSPASPPPRSGPGTE
jgi:hypothetical protein